MGVTVILKPHTEEPDRRAQYLKNEMRCDIILK